MTNLTTEEMREAAGVFQESVEHVLKNQSAEGQKEITLFLANLVYKEKPYLLVTQEGLTHIMQLVWSQPNISDFVMTMSFTFFARWGHSEESVQGLCENLARGCALVVKDLKDLNAVPAQMSERLADIDAARRLIQANKWLVIVLMAQLFVTVAPPATSK